MSTSTTSSAAPPLKKHCNCDCELLLWKNPIETGKYFGGSLLVLLIIKKINFLTFLTKLLYYIFITTSLIEFVTKLVLGNGLITKYSIKQCPNIIGLIKPYLDLFVKYFPIYQSNLRELVFAYSPKNTFNAAVSCWILNKFFNLFSLWTTLLLADISLFSLPLIYSLKQKEIDSVIDCIIKLVKEKSNELSEIVLKQLQPYLEKLGLNKQEISKKTEVESTPKINLESAKTTASEILPEPISNKINENLNNETKEFIAE